ncbi:MAG TPA: VOC family protein [Ilumatobacteraceae bacterium]|nr:VOC family protein [Ilumatobacteraceae bacterium]HRB03627.1 VOC family protein [Ilumatobacteraceae bacterium]
MDAPVTVTAFDHLVLRCADVETTLSWYVDVLGLQPMRVKDWRAGEISFPSVRVDAGTIIDLVGRGDEADFNGSVDHFCLVIDEVDLEALAASGVFEVIGAPATRYGARGNGTSLYVRDPDGRIIELRHY